MIMYFVLVNSLPFPPKSCLFVMGRQCKHKTQNSALVTYKSGSCPLYAGVDLLRYSAIFHTKDGEHKHEDLKCQTFGSRAPFRIRNTGFSVKLLLSCFKRKSSHRQQLSLPKGRPNQRICRRKLGI